MAQTPAGAYLALLPDPVQAALVDLVLATQSVTDEEVLDLMLWIDGMATSILTAATTPEQAFIGGTVARVGAIAGAISQSRRDTAEEVL